LVHHLTTLGDDWDGFLNRNGFATVFPIETTVVGGPLIGKPFDCSSNRPRFLKESPHGEAIPDRFLHGQHDVGFESNETPVHELVVRP
jgi:hypothetical protein